MSQFRRSLAVVAVMASVLIALVMVAPVGASAATNTYRITMNDGVTLEAVLTGDDTATPKPTVVEFTPYGNSSASFAVDDDFNYLLVEIRGTGDSDGAFDALGPQSQEDVATSLQWACTQSWSNGHLAVAGFSASAIMIFNSLHEKLPCVDAAVLRSGTFELYRDLLVPGGITNIVPGAAVLGLIGAPALAQGSQRLQRNPSSALTTLQGLFTAGLNAGLLHPTLDSFWAQRGYRGDVNHVPTLFLDGAYDVEPRGDYQGFQALRAAGADPHLLVVGGHDGAPAGTDNGVAEIGKWLDHYVRGVDNGVQNEPAVQMLLPNGDREDMLAGTFVRYDAADWPVPGTTWNALNLSSTRAGSTRSLNDGSLTLSPVPKVATQIYPALFSLPTNTDPNTIATIGGGYGGPFNKLADFIPALTNMDLSNLTGLTYTTPALRSPVTVAGPADLDIKLASLMPTSGIWAVISDVAPDGTSHPLAVGRLNTAFPKIVSSKSLYSHGHLVQPYGDYSTTSIGLPGIARKYHVEIWPVLNRFEVGHRIQLSIVGQSALSVPALPSINSVTVGGNSGTRLMLPTLPGNDLAGALR